MIRSRCNILRVVAYLAVLVIASLMPGCAPRFQAIEGFPDTTNARIAAFLDESRQIEGRKVAIFDCDGTLLGQCPHYLADEAIYGYAANNYLDAGDERSREKMAIVEAMTSGSNVSTDYVTNRIRFFSGLTTHELGRLGLETFDQRFAGKIYPEMRDLVAQLHDHGFEVWVITASNFQAPMTNSCKPVEFALVIGHFLCVLRDSVVNNPNSGRVRC